MPTCQQIPTRPFLARFPLRRIITSNRFIPEVDGFRFLAIVIVIFSHIYVQCGPVPGSRLFQAAFADGKRGVYLFFTISGFILGLPFARHHLQQGSRVNVRSYFRRRITRLEPPYVIAMLLRFPVVLMYKHAAFSSVFLHLLASLFYVHSLIFQQYSTINPPAWSLEVEIQFYLLAPLLTGIFLVRSKPLRRALLTACIIVAGVAATVFVNPAARLSLTLLNYLHYFLAGFLLCDLYLANDYARIPAWIWDGIGIVAILWVLYSQARWYPVLLPFVAIALYMAGFHGGVVRAFFSFAPISIIGGMCYSLYLTHSTVLAAMTPLVHRLAHSSLSSSVQSGLIFGVCFTGVLFIGFIYFVLIERPCMNPNWPQQLVAKLRVR